MKRLDPDPNELLWMGRIIILLATALFGLVIFVPPQGGSGQLVAFAFLLLAWGLKTLTDARKGKDRLKRAEKKERASDDS